MKRKQVRQISDHQEADRRRGKLRFAQMTSKQVGKQNTMREKQTILYSKTKQSQCV